MSKKTVEKSTYGSELVASRIATELILEIRYMLRSLGVIFYGSTLMLGDNMSVVLNTIVPSSVLKKKHKCNCISPIKTVYCSKDDEVCIHQE
jgi:hypothetical protein